MLKLCNSRVVRPTEFAKRLGVSKPTLWRWERAGHLPPKRQIGPSAVGWLESEIEAWWAEKTASHPPSDSDESAPKVEGKR